MERKQRYTSYWLDLNERAMRTIAMMDEAAEMGDIELFTRATHRWQRLTSLLALRPSLERRDVQTFRKGHGHIQA